MRPDAMLCSQKIVTSPYLTVTVEDWSGVRSPSRAIRRRRYGHRQNIVRRAIPDPNAHMIYGVLHMHPDTLREFERQVATCAALEDKG